MPSLYSAAEDAVAAALSLAMNDITSLIGLISPSHVGLSLADFSESSSPAQRKKSLNPQLNLLLGAEDHQQLESQQEELYEQESSLLSSSEDEFPQELAQTKRKKKRGRRERERLKRRIAREAAAAAQIAQEAAERAAPLKSVIPMPILENAWQLINNEAPSTEETHNFSEKELQLSLERLSLAHSLSAASVSSAPVLELPLETAPTLFSTDSMGDLLRQISTPIQPQSAANRKTLLAYLTSPECKLFSAIQSFLSLNSEFLDVLLCVGKGVNGTLARLNKFDAQNRKFYSLTELILAVEHKEIAHNVKKRETIVQYFLHSNLFTRKLSESEINRDFLDQLVHNVGSIHLLLQLLKQLDNSSCKFSNFADILPVITAMAEREKLLAIQLSKQQQIQQQVLNQAAIQAQQTAQAKAQQLLQQAYLHQQQEQQNQLIFNNNGGGVSMEVYQLYLLAAQQQQQQQQAQAAAAAALLLQQQQYQHQQQLMLESYLQQLQLHQAAAIQQAVGGVMNPSLLTSDPTNLLLVQQLQQVQQMQFHYLLQQQQQQQFAQTAQPLPEPYQTSTQSES
jgi:RES domain-containing protein